MRIHQNDLVKIITFLTLLASVAVGVYIVMGCSSYRCGFPLDDAWIHQTYAKNLWQFHEWSFIPGTKSAGSTAPLWSVILSIGYMLRINPLIWAFFLGWIFLVLLAWILMLALSNRIRQNTYLIFLIGLLIVLEWHFVWSAVSGMETLLISVIFAYVILYLIPQKKSWILIGIVSGAACWVRPDGFTLLLPAAVGLLFTPADIKTRIHWFVRFLSGYVLIIIPYLLFNQYTGSTWLPHTFFAKQAEYAELQSLTFVKRLLQQATIPLIGVGSLLLPGFIKSLILMINEKDYASMGSVLWLLTYIALYALRLPVTYQHGRYIIPTLPIFLFWGIVGLLSLLGVLEHFWKGIIKRVWIYSLVATQIAFFILGSIAYGKDVAFIESEMVNVAKWLNKNIEKNAKIAVHDIGAVGFICECEIIDLAGLVSPEVIPYIRDEDSIRIYLNEKNAKYLVTFPSWYPQLTKDLEIKFSSESDPSHRYFGEKMTVYKWNE